MWEVKIQLTVVAKLIIIDKHFRLLESDTRITETREYTQNTDNNRESHLLW